MSELFWIYGVLVGVLMYIYLQYANRNRIIDVPNERSSHTHQPVRGIGIVFLSAVMVAAIYIYRSQWILCTALALGGVTGYLDDRFSLKVRWRLALYSLVCVLLVYQFSIFSPERSSSTLWLAVMVILMLGIVNVFNFMDGINGITGLYAIVLIGTMYFLPYNGVHTSLPLADLLVLALILFLVLNLRSKALAFMGDSGSILVGAFCAYTVLGLVYRSGNVAYLLLLSVYGIDSLTTIAVRLINKENVTQAHRTHAYQLLSNEAGWGHVPVSILYALLQLLINLLLYEVVLVREAEPTFLIAIVLISLILLYFAVKLRYHRDSLKLWRTSDSQ